MIISFKFTSGDSKRRLAMLAGMLRSTLYGSSLNERSRMIFGYHPDWLNISRGDYNLFYAGFRELTDRALSGETVTRDDMAQMLWDIYQPRLADFIFAEHYDTGDLYRDIESATPEWADG